MRIWWSLVFTTLMVSASFAQDSPKVSSRTQIQQRLDQSVPQWLKQHDVPSVAVAYIENGRLAWTAVYGDQSPGIPATEKTLYNVASLTKPISAELILRLVSAGKVSLDEPISSSWIDADVKDNPWHKLLTPRLCLSHQTGFTNWRAQTNNVLTFQWEPGTRTGYSGEGYDYVARFAEKKLGMPFEQLAKQYVFDPIGMNDTSYTSRPWYAGHLAIPHGAKGETEPKTSTAWTAADLLRTTIGDYAKFLLSVMNNERVTTQIAAERLTSTRNLPTPEQEKQVCAHEEAGATKCQVAAGLGLGWQVIKHNDITIIDHDGSDWGVRTLAFFVPQRRIGVVILTNGENGIEVEREIVRILYPDAVFVATL